MPVQGKESWRKKRPYRPRAGGVMAAQRAGWGRYGLGSLWLGGLVWWGFFVLPIAGALAAEDTVVVATGKEGQGRSRLVGEILDYTGAQLQLRLPSGREETIDGERVVEVETAWGVKQREGDQRLSEGNYREALALYREAVSEESRVWVRRQMLAQCVWCYRHLGQLEQAGDTFLIVYQNDPTTQYFDAIPLSWSPLQPTLTLERRAESWLGREQSPAAQLLGASWLLSTAQRGAAIQVLRNLASAADVRIVHLAEAQLWRTRVVTATAEDLVAWQQRLEQMPAAIRPGPYFLWGQALARHEQREQAAVAFLRLPILYPEHRELAPLALVAAGRELEKIGQLPQAARLYREVITDHPDSPARAEAQQRWKSVTRHHKK